MCLLIVVSRPGGDVPLVVGANRDEQLDRPATPMVVHREASPRIVGGRDELAGGTWLAVNDAGVVVGLTNKPVAGGRDAARRSRGELPLALASHTTAAAAAEAVLAFRPDDFNPCWLLVADRTSVFAVDMTGGEVPGVRELGPGVHVQENRAPDAPSSKVDQVRGLLGESPDDLVDDRIVLALSDHNPSTGPTAGMEAGIDGATEASGAACVHTERYGTRWSCVVSVPAAGVPSVRYADGPPCTTPFVDAEGDRLGH